MLHGVGRIGGKCHREGISDVDGVEKKLRGWALVGKDVLR